MRVLRFLFSSLIVAVVVLIGGLRIYRASPAFPTPYTVALMKGLRQHAGMDTESDPSATAVAFQNALRQGKASSAYAMTSSGFQERFDTESFNELVRRNPILAKHNLIVLTDGCTVIFCESAYKNFCVTLTQEPDGYRVADIKFGNER